MLSAIYCEFFKLKRLKLPLMSLICNLIPIIIGHSVSYYDNLIVLQDYFKAIMVISWILFIVLFALVTGMMFSDEYKNNTIKNMFCYPMSRAKLFGAKIIAFMCIIILTYAASLLIAVISLLLVKHRPFSGALILQVLVCYTISIIGFICFASLSAAVCIFTQKVTYPLILSFICILCLFAFSQWGSISSWRYFCPATNFLELSLGILQGQKVSMEMLYLSCFGSIISLIGGCIFSISILNKRDIK